MEKDFSGGLTENKTERYWKDTGKVELKHLTKGRKE